MAQNYGFEKVTLQTFVKQFPDAQVIVDAKAAGSLATKTLQVTNNVTTEVDISGPPITSTLSKYPTKSPEQHKLEVANAINEILSKRILKSKGTVHDDIENEMRHFLNSKLGRLLGGATTSELSLTQDEIKFYKTMYKRANDKGVS